MVLESLFNPFVIKRKPWETFFAGAFYSFVALLLAYFVFKEVAGILMVFLIVIATLPMLYTTFKTEEELDLKYDQEWRLLREHGKVLTFLLFLFCGITVALVISYVFFPREVVSTAFNLQERAIINVNQNVQGAITGGAARFTFFTKIFVNNLKVLFFCLVFSLLYGAGAIFILAWNASVIATAIGNLIKTEIAQIASTVGLSSISAYFSAVAFGFFRYMIHGIIEVAAYFVIAIAGAILSVAIIKHDIKEDRILIDVLDLAFISLGLLVVGAVVEVYVTPLLFS